MYISLCIEGFVPILAPGSELEQGRICFARPPYCVSKVAQSNAASRANIDRSTHGIVNFKGRKDSVNYVIDMHEIPLLQSVGHLKPAICDGMFDQLREEHLMRLA